MRGYLRFIAGLLITLGSVAAAISLLRLFAGSSAESAEGGTILGVALGVTVSAGVIWVLIEIAAAVAPEKSVAKEAETF